MIAVLYVRWGGEKDQGQQNVRREREKRQREEMREKRQE